MFCNLAAVCGLVVGFAAVASSQATSNSTATTGDPKAVLLSAAAANGAGGADAKPWHTKISFTTTSPDGNSSQGTFEEFWASPSKYKRTFVSPAFNQVEYGTADGPRRTGTADSAPADIQQIIDEFLNPIPLSAAAIAAAKVQAQPLTVGSATLNCVSVVLAATATQPASMTSYCVDQDPPALRLTVAEGGLKKTIRDSIVKFQDRWVAQSISHYVTAPPPPGPKGAAPPAPKADFTAKMEALETLGQVDEAMFTAPADAVAAPKLVTLDEKTTKKQLLQHPMADYPEAAKWQHAAGVVVVAVRIKTDGHVSNLRVVSGNPALNQAALDAIGKWTYKPFVVDGQPVEVETTASTTFTLMR